MKNDTRPLTADELKEKIRLQELAAKMQGALGNAIGSPFLNLSYSQVPREMKKADAREIPLSEVKLLEERK